MNIKYSFPGLAVSLVLGICLFFIGCEKDDLTSMKSSETGTLLPDSVAHPVYPNSNWVTCGPANVYQLTDANFNPQPVGPVPVGELRIGSGVDSMVVQANVNAYWHVTAISWRCAATEADLGNAVWETDSIAVPGAYASIHLPRPVGSSTEVQVRVRCEKFNLYGATVYEAWFSPMSHLRQDGSKYVHIELPQYCCETGGGPSSI